MWLKNSSICDSSSFCCFTFSHKILCFHQFHLEGDGQLTLHCISLLFHIKSIKLRFMLQVIVVACCIRATTGCYHTTNKSALIWTFQIFKNNMLCAFYFVIYVMWFGLMKQNDYRLAVCQTYCCYFMGLFICLAYSTRFCA